MSCRASKSSARRLKVIIDDSDAHGEPHSAETQAEEILSASAGTNNVKRQHMSNLQHNKTIVVDGPKVQAVVCGSTNFTWRGFFVQSNNAVVLRGKTAVKPFLAAFDDYWQNDDGCRFRQDGLRQMDGSRIERYRRACRVFTALVTERTFGKDRR